MAYPLAMTRGWLVFLVACSTGGGPDKAAICDRYVAREVLCNASHIKTDEDRQMIESLSRTLCMTVDKIKAPSADKLRAELRCLDTTTDCTAYDACKDKIR